jgi:hypothetical protein
LNFGAVSKLPGFVNQRPLLFGRHKLAALDRGDGDLFPEHDVRAKPQEVEVFVRNQPFTEPLRPES